MPFFFPLLLLSLPIGHSKHTTKKDTAGHSRKRRRKTHTGWWWTRRKVSSHMGRGGSGGGRCGGCHAHAHTHTAFCIGNRNTSDCTQHHSFTHPPSLPFHSPFLFPSSSSASDGQNGWLADTDTRSNHSTSTAEEERRNTSSQKPTDSHERPCKQRRGGEACGGQTQDREAKGRVWQF